jgi:hypothetical protein
MTILFASEIYECSKYARVLTHLFKASVTKKSITTLTPRDLEALGIAVLRRLAVPTVNGDDASSETDGIRKWTFE